MNRYYDHKVGDLLLLKSGRKVSRWTIIQVEEQGFRAKNLATRRTRKFTADSKHIIIPPDAEVPESLRKQIPRDVGVCRATGLRYKLYSKTELEVIDIQQESESVISFDFAVEDGEPAWNLAEEKHVNARNSFFVQNEVKLPAHLISEIEAQIGESF